MMGCWRRCSRISKQTEVAGCGQRIVKMKLPLAIWHKMENVFFAWNCDVRIINLFEWRLTQFERYGAGPFWMAAHRCCCCCPRDRLQPINRYSKNNYTQSNPNEKVRATMRAHRRPVLNAAAQKWRNNGPWLDFHCLRTRERESSIIAQARCNCTLASRNEAKQKKKKNLQIKML